MVPPVVILVNATGQCAMLAYLVFIEKHSQLFDADTKISLIELVRNVPS